MPDNQQGERQGETRDESDEQGADNTWVWFGLVGFFGFGMLGFMDEGGELIWWTLAAASMVGFLLAMIEWQ